MRTLWARSVGGAAEHDSKSSISGASAGPGFLRTVFRCPFPLARRSPRPRARRGTSRCSSGGARDSESNAPRARPEASGGGEGPGRVSPRARCAGAWLGSLPRVTRSSRRTPFAPSRRPDLRQSAVAVVEEQDVVLYGHLNYVPAYSSRRRNQSPVSLRPFGARSSHWYIPHRASRPRA